MVSYYEMLEDMDDIETLEPINYEREFKKFDEKLLHNHYSFLKSCVKDEVELETDNVLDSLRRKIQMQSEDSEQSKRKHAEYSKRSEDLAKMKQEVERITAETRASAESAELNRKTASERGEKLAGLRRQRESQSSVADQERQSVTAELDRFRQTLGLEILPSTHGGTLFIFTNIDRNNPDKKFSFELAIGE